MRRGSALEADPVLALLIEARADPRALYYLWEQQQWQAGKVDLALDARQWDDLDPATRRLVADSIAWRRLRAEIATTALVPFVDVAPAEEQQVFLTTQLVDEARHLVFFDRVHAEVAGQVGDKLEDRGGIVDDDSLRSLLTERLATAAADLRGAGAGLVELAAGTAIFHLVILGALGLTDQGAIQRFLAELDVLPGVRGGLELEARAARRHVAFGLGLLDYIIDREVGARTAALAALETGLPLALAALGSVGALAPAPYPSAELEAAASEALGRWCEGVGLEIKPAPTPDSELRRR